MGVRKGWIEVCRVEEGEKFDRWRKEGKRKE